ncbi:DsbA family oxidoreductase [Paenibacillus sp. D2_2]|uniref:DsbA family oxidoreductase n=1 Tax=Paenibacillus sp. D2_2 TaxID=3073092 RepID=UPI002815CAC9|nr:DsbA family oxidoreductase [Paenibacillus sp. D2_2]WMT38853.1 DsbA family oxidoreductase [Paenibacillus sp. D2_2]
MKVEIWSDIACPFCYIGKRKFEQALEQFPHKDQVELVFKSFQLDPNAPKQYDESMEEMLAHKYGISVEQARGMNDQVVAQARDVGLDYHLDTAVMTNTLDAHRVGHYADTKGNGKEMMERLLSAYFTESKHVGDHDVLADLAAEVGLDAGEVKQMLAGDEYKEQVIGDQQEGARLGVQAVPFFVLNRKYAVRGAQPMEAFLGALNQVWEEENPKTKLDVLGSDGATCTDDSCSL